MSAGTFYGKYRGTVINNVVSAIMTADVQTCEESTTLDDLMQTMTTGRFRHIPVVEEGRLTGIVSIGDVVKNRIDELETERAALTDYITGGAR